MPIKKKSKRLKFGQDEILCTGGLLSGNIDFRDEEEMRAAWFANRDWLLTEYAQDNHGLRPWAWWKYESQRPFPGQRDLEVEALQEMGVMSQEHVRHWEGIKRLRAGKARLVVAK